MTIQRYLKFSVKLEHCMELNLKWDLEMLYRGLFSELNQYMNNLFSFRGQGKHLNKNEGHMKSISKPHTVGGWWWLSVVTNYNIYTFNIALLQGCCWSLGTTFRSTDPHQINDVFALKTVSFISVLCDLQTSGCSVARRFPLWQHFYIIYDVIINRAQESKPFILQMHVKQSSQYK